MRTAPWRPAPLAAMPWISDDSAAVSPRLPPLSLPLSLPLPSPGSDQLLRL